MKRANHLSWMRRAVVLTVTAIAAMTGTIALADDGMISYMAEEGAVETIAESETVDITTKVGATTLQDGKTYVINHDTMFIGSINVDGDATLVIRNGATVTACGGIRCAKGNSIRICCEEGTSSTLRASNENGAGIGGGKEEDCGKVVICGGTVEATACSNPYFAAGIGGGSGTGDGGDVRIYDATVVAKGDGGAGIGGSAAGYGGDVTIVRSNVTATSEDAGHGGNGSAGIGGGQICGFDDAGDGGRVHIIDSVVYAKGGGDSAGIGGGGDILESPADQGDGGDVIIEGDSVVEAESGGAGSAIGRGDDEGDPGKVRLGDGLKVTDLSRNVGTVAGAVEREGYCFYRRHVKIEPCNHEKASYEKSEAAHKFRCPHCYGFEEEAEQHDLSKHGDCQICDYHMSKPFFIEPTLGVESPDYVVFWLNFGDMDDQTYKEGYIDLTLEAPGKQVLNRRDWLSQYRGRRETFAGYPTWVIDEEDKDAVITATVHYGKDQTVTQTTTLAECRARAEQSE